ncbi:probable 3-hydroxyisobutyryl-CoA hydrolase 3 [Coffea eugenioides]|uniref:probable 3-hydroxyisobutyryl-CoA hydrolase 3 n=1 Tax=Coffea eugenioides TaxID=49369 RepID=UPI000F60AEB5|nr:probable 3-hydroxyisobutyryl-CoA hydrolase 3 [Coffea eugenioides]
MENALDSLAASGSVDLSSISKTIHKFVHGPHLKKDSVYKRLDAINECFSKDTAEEMLSSLEELAAKNEEKWIVHAIKSMTSVSPTSLKIFLRLGGRALLVEKGRQPQWMPSKLDLVSDEMVGKYFCEVDNDDDWEPLHLPPRPAPAYFAPSRL